MLHVAGGALLVGVAVRLVAGVGRPHLWRAGHHRGFLGEVGPVHGSGGLECNKWEN